MTRTILAAAMLLSPSLAFSQATPPSTSTPARMTRTERSELTQNAPLTSLKLKYATQPNDANEILTGLRLMLDPSVKLYLVNRDNTIVMRALPDDVALAMSLVNELDRPRASYRLTFTLSQYDGSHRISGGDYTMTVLDGQRTTLRQGIRLPVLTGHSDGSGGAENTMSYVDVGLSFDATVSANESGAILREKVEQSSLSEPQPAVIASNPASVNPSIHQTVMEGVTSLQLGRMTPLGTLDSQGAGRRTQVEVKLERLP